MMSVGWSSVCCSRRTLSKTRLSQGPRHRNAMQPRALVGDQVVIGDPLPMAIIFRVRPSMHCADRDDEPDTIRGGDIATAPGMDEGDGILCRDQEGIPLGERLGAEVMLTHPDQTRPLEGRYVLTDQRARLVWVSQHYLRTET